MVVVVAIALRSNRLRGVLGVSNEGALDEASSYGRRARRRKVAKWSLFGIPRVSVTELLCRAFCTHSCPCARSVRKRLCKRKDRWRLCKRNELWRISERVVTLLLRKRYHRHDIRSERGYRRTLDLFLRAKTNPPLTVLGGTTVRVVTLIGAELWVLFQIYLAVRISTPTIDRSLSSCPDYRIALLRFERALAGDCQRAAAVIVVNALLVEIAPLKAKQAACSLLKTCFGGCSWGSRKFYC